MPIWIDFYEYKQHMLEQIYYDIIEYVKSGRYNSNYFSLSQVIVKNISEVLQQYECRLEIYEGNIFYELPEEVIEACSNLKQV